MTQNRGHTGTGRVFLFFPTCEDEKCLKLRLTEPFSRDIMYTNVASGLTPVLPSVDESSAYFMRLNHAVMNVLQCTQRPVFFIALTFLFLYHQLSQQQTQKSISKDFLFFP